MSLHDTKTNDLTQGGITGTILRFAIPMILGNLLQQCYNIADTFIVGHYLGADALAAVGSAYTLMVFITSVFIGLCMGSGAVFSLQYGAKDYEGMKRSLVSSLVLTGGITLILNIAVLAGIHPIIRLLQTPAEIEGLMFDYLFIIFLGIISTFIYNYYAYLLRALGQFHSSALFSGCFRGTEYSTRPDFYSGMSLGCVGSSSGYRHIADRSSCRTLRLCLVSFPDIQAETESHPPPSAVDKGNSHLFLADVHAAVGDEFRDSDGAGTGKQFRNMCNGGFCRCCKN